MVRSPVLRRREHRARRAAVRVRVLPDGLHSYGGGVFSADGDGAVGGVPALDGDIVHLSLLQRPRGGGGIAERARVHDAVHGMRRRRARSIRTLAQGVLGVLANKVMQTYTSSKLFPKMKKQKLSTHQARTSSRSWRSGREPARLNRTPACKRGGGDDTASVGYFAC